jgi:hypothetical protein
VPAYTESAGELCRVDHLSLVMYEHLPVPPQRLCWDARTECGNIALKVGLDEGETPGEAVLFIGGKETVREAAAHPKLVSRANPSLCDFAHRKWSEFFVSDASGKGFGGLL